MLTPDIRIVFPVYQNIQSATKNLLGPTQHKYTLRWVLCKFTFALSPISFHDEKYAALLKGIDEELYQHVCLVNFDYLPKEDAPEGLVGGSMFIPVVLSRDNIEETEYERLLSDAFVLGRRSIRAYSSPSNLVERVEITDESVLHPMADVITAYFWKCNVQHPSKKADYMLKEQKTLPACDQKKTQSPSTQTKDRNITQVAKTYLIARVGRIFNPKFVSFIRIILISFSYLPFFRSRSLSKTSLDSIAMTWDTL